MVFFLNQHHSLGGQHCIASEAVAEGDIGLALEL